MKLIEPDEIGQSPWRELSIATGRANCRICGNKIKKGCSELKFAASFSDGSYNAWTATECHAHIDCAPIEYRSQW